MSGNDLSLAETMRDLVEAGERWSEQLAQRSTWLLFFVLIVVGVAATFHAVMVLYYPSTVNYVIILVSWVIFAITIQKYYGFMASSRRERDEWKRRFSRLRTRNEELLDEIKGQ
jgi:hypothetical protein